MKDFEVVIIGGGPAGAMCGIELQKLGIATCIIDSAEFPRTKLCGALLTQKSVDLMRKYCPEIKPEEFIISQCDTIDFYNNNAKITTIKTSSTYYATDRKIFDYLLIKRYIAIGGTLIENSPVHQNRIDDKNNIIQLGSEQISYKTLIGADGCNSVLMRKYHIARADGFCLEGKTTNDHTRNVGIFFGYADGGYGWFFPKTDFCVVGLGGDNSHKQVKPQAETLFASLNPLKVYDIKGAIIPSGRKAKHDKLPQNMLVVGDAAGFIDPITGEGIYFALLSGVLAAQSIVEASKQNVNLKKIYAQKNRGIRKMIKQALFLQKILYCRPVLNKFLNIIRTHHSFATFYLEKVMSTYQYSYGNFIYTYFTKYRKKK